MRLRDGWSLVVLLLLLLVVVLLLLLLLRLLLRWVGGLTQRRRRDHNLRPIPSLVPVIIPSLSYQPRNITHHPSNNATHQSRSKTNQPNRQRRLIPVLTGDRFLKTALLSELLLLVSVQLFVEAFLGLEVSFLEIESL